MNKVITYICLFLICSSCTTFKSGESGMNVQVKIIGKLNTDEFNAQEGAFYSVNINLLNNSDTVIRFWTMTCSWQDNWISNSNNMCLYNNGCDSNVPTLREIKPGKKITYTGIIHFYKADKSINVFDFKLGYILIKDKEVIKLSDFRKIISDKINIGKGIIWSETFRISY